VKIDLSGVVLSSVETEELGGDSGWVSGDGVEVIGLGVSKLELAAIVAVSIGIVSMAW
jgi:hypothetical protein